MRRRLFNVLLVLSLLVGLLTAVFWVLSFAQPQAIWWGTRLSTVDLQFPADDAESAKSRTYDIATRWQLGWNRGFVWCLKVKQWQGRRPDGSRIVTLPAPENDPELVRLETSWHPVNPSTLGRLGFVFVLEDMPGDPTNPDYNSVVAMRGVASPFWFPGILFLLLPAVVLMKRMIARRRGKGFELVTKTKV